MACSACAKKRKEMRQAAKRGQLIKTVKVAVSGIKLMATQQRQGVIKNAKPKK